MNNIDAQLAYRILNAFTNSNDNLFKHIYSSSESFYATDKQTVISINKSLVSNHSELVTATLVNESITDRFKIAFDTRLDFQVNLLDNDAINQLRSFVSSIKDEGGNVITLLYDELFTNMIEFSAVANYTLHRHSIQLNGDSIHANSRVNSKIMKTTVDTDRLLKMLNLFANSSTLEISFSSPYSRIKIDGANMRAITLPNEQDFF